MSRIFLRIFNTSVSASYLVLAVLIARLVLKKAPKWVRVLLWAVVGLRLMCPFTLESALSLIPSAHTLPQTIALSPPPRPLTADFPPSTMRSIPPCKPLPPHRRVPASIPCKSICPLPPGFG